MRMVDNETGRELKSVLVLLTPGEAKYVTDVLPALDVATGDHVHVNDDSFTREITVAVYTPDNMQSFSEDVRRLIDDPDGSVLGGCASGSPRRRMV